MPVVVQSLVAADASTSAAVAELGRQLADVSHEPNIIFVIYGQTHDDDVIMRFLTDRFPGVPVVGGTSCSGAMSADGIGGAESIGLLLVHDPDGSYGVAATELGTDPAGAAEQTLLAALDAADCTGELPELVWVYQCPGTEELVADGLRRVVGDRCPIIGGSSADEKVAGAWRQLGPDGPMTNGLVVSVLFSSGGIGFGFQGGYEPTGTNGVVTGLGYSVNDSGVVTAGSRRHILEIDGEPAAQVYNRWIGGTLPPDVLEHGGTILADTSMTPIAVSTGSVSEVAHYRLIHPESVSPQGGLTTFADVDSGTRVYGMRGDRDRLVQRVGRVASAAISALPSGPHEVAGGMVIYCAGCLLAVDDRADQVAATAAEAFDGAPFLGCFTFGEQGTIVDRNVHGNLMISAIAFGR